MRYTSILAMLCLAKSHIESYPKLLARLLELVNLIRGTDPFCLALASLASSLNLLLVHTALSCWSPDAGSARLLTVTLEFSFATRPARDSLPAILFNILSVMKIFGAL